MKKQISSASYLWVAIVSAAILIAGQGPAFAVYACKGEIFVSCFVGKNRHLKVCIEPAAAEAEPKFVYSFVENHKEGLLLSESFSAKTVSPWSGVGRAINSTVSFNHKAYQYQVWQSYDRLDKEAVLQAGVRVFKGERNIASHSCLADNRTRIAPILTLEDAMKAAGWCYNTDSFEWQSCAGNNK